MVNDVMDGITFNGIIKLVIQLIAFKSGTAKGVIAIFDDNDIICLDGLMEEKVKEWTKIPVNGRME